MKALSQATLAELAGAVRGYTLHGRADGYVLSVQHGLHEAALTAKRGGARRFAGLDTALALLRTLRAAAIEVRLADTAPVPLLLRAPRRPGRAGPAARRGLHGPTSRAAGPVTARSPRLTRPHARTSLLREQRASRRLVFGGFCVLASHLGRRGADRNGADRDARNTHPLPLLHSWGLGFSVQRRDTAMPFLSKA